MSAPSVACVALGLARVWTVEAAVEEAGVAETVAAEPAVAAEAVVAEAAVAAEAVATAHYADCELQRPALYTQRRYENSELDIAGFLWPHECVAAEGLQWSR
eukprot:scaffold15577_cov35-Tisochrysis_lutea.AAC.6